MSILGSASKFSRGLNQYLGELELFWKTAQKKINLILSQEDMLSLRRRCHMLQCFLCPLRGPRDLTSNHRKDSILKCNMKHFLSLCYLGGGLSFLFAQAEH